MKAPAAKPVLTRNRRISGALRELADLLELQGANPFRAGLSALLGRRPRPHGKEPEVHGPGVDILLGVDREYLEKAAAGRLPLIAPRRFNPERKAWLPVLHAQRGRWSFTALFSNTARAHELGKIHDWVVIYFYDDHHREEQHTVVTEMRGPLAGRRVVRGREAECRALYGQEERGAAA